MLAVIAYGTALFGTLATFLLLWWLYRHERAPAKVTQESVAVLVHEQYPAYSPEIVTFSADGACALLASGRDGEALILPVGRHLVFWRLASGTFARALAERADDGRLMIRTGDLTRPRIAFVQGTDFEAFAGRIATPAAAQPTRLPHKEFAA